MKFLLTLSAAALALASSSAEAASCSSLYGQCGGIGFSGATCCASGSTCVYQNDYYSQCLPGSAASSTSTTAKSTTTTAKSTSTTKASTTTTTTTKSTTTTTKTTTATASPTVESSSCADIWGQCGGNGWSGTTCCPSGSTCVPQNGNQYYSQCIPNSSITASAASTTKASTTTTTKAATTNAASTTTTKASTTKTTTTSAAATTTPATSANYSVISGGSSGSGTTTRYWDCCKASCSWPGKASVSSPVDVCGANGISMLDENTVSGCNGGSGFMCNNNQPWAINDDLAYGFAAASISGSSESGWCCGCYEITFTSTAVSGKKMVVQVTNTGGDLGANHFDLQIPGGGVGIFDGCSVQWGAPSGGWGARYGGISDVSECNNLPSALQAGCKWRFNWFKNADNPSMTFKEVTCPAELVSRTGCQRN